MSYLRLVTEELTDGPFAQEAALPSRLPHGRHGIPANVVVEHQRQRLLAGIAEALVKHGYANVTTTLVSKCAGISSGTYYKHFGNLWDCLLAAYVMTADRLCERIKEACAEQAALQRSPLETGIEAALAFFSAEPATAVLLSTQPPREGVAIAAARRHLIARLVEMLRGSRDPRDDTIRPPGLDERMIDATLAFVGARVSAGETERLMELGPELSAILDCSRRAA
jgi:AcrR family transcriptional regulator